MEMDRLGRTYVAASESAHPVFAGRLAGTMPGGDGLSGASLPSGSWHASDVREIRASRRA